MVLVLCRPIASGRNDPQEVVPEAAHATPKDQSIECHQSLTPRWDLFQSSQVLIGMEFFRFFSVGRYRTTIVLSIADQLIFPI